MEFKFDFDELADPLNFFGSQDQYLKTIEKELEVVIYHRGRTLTIEGPEEQVKKAYTVLEKLSEQSSLKTKGVKAEDVRILLEQARLSAIDEALPRSVKVSSGNKYIFLKTFQQQKYFKSIMDTDVSFGIGPAGTGKTYIAVAIALNFLLTEKVKKIILTRPVVEAGENLGFLPGNLEEKINPYLKPLMDSIYDMLSIEEIVKYKERGQIEIAPLAYMRGRTLNNAFIILDEAQNTTVAQMKMFLTRLGHHAKIVVTGDVTQKDLPGNQHSGLDVAREILSGIPQIGFTYFGKKDVVRHPIVIKIIEAFEEHEEKK